MPLPDWALTISQLDIMFPDRLGLNMNKKYDFSVVEKLAWHSWVNTPIESAINALQQHGCDSCPDYSQDSFERYTSTAIVSRNLIKLGDVIIRKERKKLDRKKYTFKPQDFSKAA